MSSLAIDIIIWILLITGAGFGLIGLIGLSLFPDTRSRMYTAVRATLISISAITLAVIILGLYASQAAGGSQYQTLVLHTLLLFGVVAIANLVVSSTVLERTRPKAGNPPPPGTARGDGDKK